MDSSRRHASSFTTKLSTATQSRGSIQTESQSVEVKAVQQLFYIHVDTDGCLGKIYVDTQEEEGQHLLYRLPAFLH